MFGIGESELVIILLFAFMLFGPDKLPGMGRTIGRALRQFRSAQEGFTKVVQTEVIDPATEAMNMSATKPNRDRAAEVDDEDADIETPEGSDAPRKKPTETFAERKARLAAERKAREEAAAAEAAAAEVEGADADEQADAPEAAAGAQVAAAEEPAEKAAEEEAEPSTVSDLYALSTKRRKSSRRKAAEEKAAAEAAAAEAAAEAAAAEAAAAAEEENPTETAGDEGAPEAEASAPTNENPTETAGDEGAPEAEASAPVQLADADEPVTPGEEDLVGQSAAASAAKPSDETSSPALESDNANATGEEDGSDEA